MDEGIFSHAATISWRTRNGNTKLTKEVTTRVRENAGLGREQIVHSLVCERRVPKR
jgi:hypothetical protein